MRAAACSSELVERTLAHAVCVTDLFGRASASLKCHRRKARHERAQHRNQHKEKQAAHLWDVNAGIRRVTIENFSPSGTPYSADYPSSRL